MSELREKEVNIETDQVANIGLKMSCKKDPSQNVSEYRMHILNADGIRRAQDKHID